MTALEKNNPISVFIYFTAVTVIAMFCFNPLLLAISLAGGLLTWLFGDRRHGLRLHLICIFSVIIIALINPLFSHNGSTVLFVMNRNPVTLESVIYGAVFGLMVSAVIYWMHSFSQIMTSDRLLYVFGALSPKTALILSMALRYVPMFTRQSEKTAQAQKALGMYSTDSMTKRIVSGSRVFSVVVTWALENGIITADSMSARGYATGKRTRFAVFRFRKNDIIFLVLSAVLFAAAFTGIGLDAVKFSFYPCISFPELTPAAVLTYASYTALCALPCISEIKERIKWKYLLSRI